MYDRLKKICKENGLSVTALCEKATGNSGNLATWKKGYMRSDYLAICADILGVSTDYLLGREQKTAPTMRESDFHNVLNGLSDSELEELLMFARYLKYKREHQSDD